MVDEYTYWWIGDNDSWLNVGLIVAPLTIVFGLALIAYKVYSKPSSPRPNIYKPCSHLHSQHNTVYVPTTRALDGCDELNDVHIPLLNAKDASVLGVGNTAK